MNTSFALPRRLRAWGLAGSMIVAVGAFWGASTYAESHPAVNIKVDSQSIERTSGPEANSFSPIVKRVGPSVVKVLVTERAKNVPASDAPELNPLLRQFFGNQLDGQSQRRGTMRQPAQEGLGSGVIITKDGYILTNNHVVHDADEIKVTLSDGREFKAKVVGTDPQADIALIKVDAKDLPAIAFADSDKIEVGDRVLAIGNPFGIGQTVTGGMVSGLGRATLGLDYEDFIQTDAAINPGNSGGALVDVEGRLIGINTAILSRSGGSQGIGFAIPSNLVRNVADQLASTGKVVRGYLGVSIQDLTPELAKQFKLDNNNGALIGDVVAGSPAAKAGLKSGDIITEWGDKPVHDSRHLKLAVANIVPGNKVTAEVLRDGKKLNLDINVVAQPKDMSLANTDQDKNPAAKDDEGTLNGVEVADLDPRVRHEFDISPRIHGAIVTNVDPESAAAHVGLSPGDVIEEINRQPVKSAEDAIKLTSKTDSKKTLLRIWNQRGSHYLVVDESDSKAS